MAHSGKTGYVTFGGGAITDVQNWTINPTANPQTYGSSDTGGRKKRVSGTEDLTGSFQCLEEPGCDEGDTGEFIGHTGSEIYTAQIFIENIACSVDISDGGLSTWTVTFGGNGAFSHTASS